MGAALEMLHNPHPCVLEGKEGWKEDGWRCPTGAVAMGVSAVSAV